MSKNFVLVSIDPPKVTPDQARELMFYHLGMAAAFFEATPDGLDDNRHELRRSMPNDDSPAYCASYAWLETITRRFESLDSKPVARSTSRRPERPLTAAEKQRLARNGLSGAGIDPIKAGKLLNLTIRTQGRGLRVIEDDGL